LSERVNRGCQISEASIGCAWNCVSPSAVPSKRDLPKPPSIHDWCPSATTMRASTINDSVSAERKSVPGPDSSARNAGAAAAAGKPIVIGSTGLGPSHMERIRSAAAKVAIVQSPNMSVGVNLMFKVAADVARVLGQEYDVEIVETHHRFKKDAPSGTAVRLADAVATALGRTMEDSGVYGRRGMVGERAPGEIGVLAVRAGDVVGEHTLIFGGIGERFEITHRAHSRDTFARGAVRAAAWVLGKPPGLYDMADVLGIG